MGHLIESTRSHKLQVTKNDKTLSSQNKIQQRQEEHLTKLSNTWNERVTVVVHQYRETMQQMDLFYDEIASAASHQEEALDDLGKGHYP